MNGDIGKCSREKYWEELALEEKIERVGGKLEYLQGIINDQGAVIAKLKNHVHVAEQMFFSDLPQPHYGWPNNNVLNREKK